MTLWVGAGGGGEGAGGGSWRAEWRWGKDGEVGDVVVKELVMGLLVGGGWW